MAHPSTFFARTPRLKVPSGACDCHTHVFGPVETYPLLADRVYTPSDALPADTEALLAALGFDRVVLVQASAYGTDNACMLDGLRALDPRARGVACIAPDIAQNQLQALHEAGVRGVRLNIATGHDRPSSAVADEMKALAERIAPLGWHLQLFVRPNVLPDLIPIVEGLGVDVVFDHMGLVPADGFENNPGFLALLTMLAGGHAWIKVSGAYRVGPAEGPWQGVAPLARALIDARPDRIVWGSDWPHTPPHGHDGVDHDAVMPFRPLDAGQLLDLLRDWAPDPNIRRCILVDNPARLYDFA